MSERKVSGGGIGLSGALLVLFVGLKLTHYIDWSWWWVLSPVLIPLGILGAILLGIAMIFLVGWIQDRRRASRRRRSRKKK